MQICESLGAILYQTIATLIKETSFQLRNSESRRNILPRKEYSWLSNTKWEQYHVSKKLLHCGKPVIRKRELLEFKFFLLPFIFHLYTLLFKCGVPLLTIKVSSTCKLFLPGKYTHRHPRGNFPFLS